MYVYGDTRITGDLFVDDITFDDATMQDLTVTDTLTVAGITTLASSGGITTTGGQLFVATDASVSGTVTATSFVGDGSGLTGVSTNLTVRLDYHLKEHLLEQVQQSLILNQQLAPT